MSYNTSVPKNQQHHQDEDSSTDSTRTVQESLMSSFRDIPPVQELNMSPLQTYQLPWGSVSNNENRGNSYDRQIPVPRLHCKTCLCRCRPQTQRNKVSCGDASADINFLDGQSVLDSNETHTEQTAGYSGFSHDNKTPERWPFDPSSVKQENTASSPVKIKKEKKEKKTITSKTFAHGLMDMSLMTSNASQLRFIMSNPEHEFYRLLIGLLIVSVILQILSGIVLIVSDYYKSQIKEKDRQNQRKRKVMNFVALAMMMVITSVNILITAFNTPSAPVNRSPEAVPNVAQQPLFSPADYQLHSNHSEL